MTKNEKRNRIISCHGNLTVKSIAKIFGVNQSYVSEIFREENLGSTAKNQHRQFVNYKYSK